VGVPGIPEEGMMEKKRPVGIRIVAILKIVFGSIFFACVGFVTLFTLIGVSVQSIPLSMKLTGIFMSLFFLVYTVDGFFLFALKKWARKISVTLDISVILLALTVLIFGVVSNFRYGGWNIGFYGFHLLIVALFLSFIYYLTRPKVNVAKRSPATERSPE